MNLQYKKEHPCHKDWRHNKGLDGTNNTWFKKYFRQRVRTFIKRINWLPQGNIYKKFNCPYDINDFKRQNKK